MWMRMLHAIQNYVLLIAIMALEFLEEIEGSNM